MQVRAPGSDRALPCGVESFTVDQDRSKGATLTLDYTASGTAPSR